MIINKVVVDEKIEKAEFEDILSQKRIKSVFQPIVSLRDGTVMGYEALSRIINPKEINNPEQLFRLAAQYDRLWETEQLCRKMALRKLHENGSSVKNKKLFLNVSPLVIHDDKFKAGFTKEYLRRYSINPAQIVFELTERDSSMDMEGYENALEHYKEQEYRIAIDDLGSCYSGLNLICELKPHFLKLDMQLVRGLNGNSSKFALVKSLTEYAAMTNTKLIAEGIEKREELDILIQMGVHYGQGYLLGRPSETITQVDDAIISRIRQTNIIKHNMNSYGVNTLYIKHICTNCPTMAESMRVEEVVTYFEENPSVSGICITRENKVKGIITKEKLQHMLSGRYGFSLYQKKPVSAIMEVDFLEVDIYTAISSVSAIAMERKERNLYDFVVVTENENYYGIVSVKDLLMKSTEISITTAKASNPLTGLPGNLIINERMSKLIEEKTAYTVLYIDMDNFKAFNDVYGFEKGDDVIRILAQILRQQIQKTDFIGHIGGDDFVVILYHHAYQSHIINIKKEFEERTHQLYSAEDRRRNYIETKNRHGKLERFPLVSITIALTTDMEKSYASQYELVEELTARKKLAKQK